MADHSTAVSQCCPALGLIVAVVCSVSSCGAYGGDMLANIQSMPTVKAAAVLQPAGAEGFAAARCQPSHGDNTG